MPLYRGIQVSNAEDVDTVNKAVIRQIVGDVDEEFKSHRLAMECFLAMAMPSRFTQKRILELAGISEKLIDKHSQIEKLINEGKSFKREYFG